MAHYCSPELSVAHYWGRRALATRMMLRGELNLGDAAAAGVMLTCWGASCSFSTTSWGGSFQIDLIKVEESQDRDDDGMSERARWTAMAFWMRGSWSSLPNRLPWCRGQRYGHNRQGSYGLLSFYYSLDSITIPEAETARQEDFSLGRNRVDSGLENFGPLRIWD